MPVVEKMLAAKEGFDLFAEDQTGGKAISYLLEWSKNNCQFLLPGKNFDLPGLPPDSVKVYVLGPPTDLTLLKKLNPSQQDAVHSLNAMMQLSNLDTSSKLVGDALQAISSRQPSTQADNFPFNKKFTCTTPLTDQKFRLQNIYMEDEGRRIDYDWLSGMGRVWFTHGYADQQQQSGAGF